MKVCLTSSTSKKTDSHRKSCSMKENQGCNNYKNNSINGPVIILDPKKIWNHEDKYFVLNSTQKFYTVTRRPKAVHAVSNMGL